MTSSGVPVVHARRRARSTWAARVAAAQHAEPFRRAKPRRARYLPGSLQIDHALAVPTTSAAEAEPDERPAPAVAARPEGHRAFPTAPVSRHPVWEPDRQAYADRFRRRLLDELARPGTPPALAASRAAAAEYRVGLWPEVAEATRAAVLADVLPRHGANEPAPRPSDPTPIYPTPSRHPIGEAARRPPMTTTPKPKPVVVDGTVYVSDAMNPDGDPIALFDVADLWAMRPSDDIDDGD